jgi:hypothetical protein
VSVLEDLRAELERHRVAGDGSATAWTAGTVEVLAGVAPGEAADWRAVLVATEGAWESSYVRSPPTRGEIAAGLLHEREPGEPVEEWRCPGCGRIMPAVTAMGRRRMWCSGACAQRPATP